MAKLTKKILRNSSGEIIMHGIEYKDVTNGNIVFYVGPTTIGEGEEFMKNWADVKVARRTQPSISAEVGYVYSTPPDVLRGTGVVDNAQIDQNEWPDTLSGNFHHLWGMLGGEIMEAISDAAAAKLPDEEYVMIILDQFHKMFMSGAYTVRVGGILAKLREDDGIVTSMMKEVQAFKERVNHEKSGLSDEELRKLAQIALKNARRPQ